MKSFLNARNDISITRNGITMKFSVIELEKGSKGKYPGLLLSNFKREDFIMFAAKNTEVDKENSFNTLITDLVNSLVCQTCWKEVVDSISIEYKPAKDKAAPVVECSTEAYQAFEKAFIEAINREFNGERKAKERDSGWYRTEAIKFGKKAKELKGKEQADMLVDAKKLMAICKELEAKEASADADILALIEKGE